MRNKILSLTLIICAALCRSEWMPDPFCPYPSNEITRYPHSQDCTLYFECFEGTKYTQECPDGLEFNAALEQCDTPEFSRCRATTDPEPHCINSTDVTYEPYPGDCTLYWECYLGFGYLYFCPDGLWWHQELGQCDYPGDFCNNSTDVTTQTTTTLQGQPKCEDTGSDPVYYPYEGDCSRYWECTNGYAYLEECAPGLWWHQAVSECDYPGDYCDNSNATTTTVNTGATPQCADDDSFFAPYYPDCTKYWTCTNGELLLTQCPNGLWWNNLESECDYPGPFCYNSSLTTLPTTTLANQPKCDDPNQAYYPYPGDCTKYWECGNGHAYLLQCSNGLWWHQEISECDFPGDYCEMSTDTTTRNPLSTPKCTEGDESHIYPDYSDCSKYWECVNGDLLLIDCPNGLWWNPQTSQCDYPGPFCANSSYTTIPTTTLPNQPDCTDVDSAFFPYPGDCTKYWECANGQLFVIDCPEGLWWNPNKNDCDYPDSYCEEAFFNYN